MFEIKFIFVYWWLGIIEYFYLHKPLCSGALVCSKNINFIQPMYGILNMARPVSRSLEIDFSVVNCPGLLSPSVP